MYDENGSDNYKRDPQVEVDLAVSQILDSLNVMQRLTTHVSDVPLLDAIIRQLQVLKREAEARHLMSPQDILNYARSRIQQLETDSRFARFSPHQVALMVAAIDELYSLIGKIKLEPQEH